MGERHVVSDFDLFGGLHCETSAVQKVFAYHNLPVSEEMLFGLAGGIGFIYWHMKPMPAPLVGGRGGGRYFIDNIGRRTGASIQAQRTTSPRRGHAMLMDRLAHGLPTVIYADMAYLPYMGVPEEAHFGQHVIVVYGVDEDADTVYISDRARRGLTVTVEELRRARASEFPPWPPQHALFDIQLPKHLEITPKIVREALGECVKGMLNPPISNFGLAGIQKWAELVPKWPRLFLGKNLWMALMNGFIYVETGGTGGSAFRPMFARFLGEARDMLGRRGLDDAIAKYEESARIWSGIAESMLPDAYPALHRAREILWEKDRVFLAQEPGAADRLQVLNRELDSMQGEILSDLKHAPSFLPELQRNIVELYEVEKDALKALHSSVG